MEGVRTSRFPPIRDGFHVGGVTAERESPERSWARIRTYLIDNPKDDGLLRRQEIWSYQNRNRGVIKSMLKSVPNVPYRVKKRKMDKFSERSRQDSSSLVLPKLQKIDESQGRVKIRGVFSPPPKPRPLGYTKDFDTKRKEIRDQISKFESAARFLGKPTPVDDFSNAKQYDAAKNTLKTISERYPYIPEQQHRNIPSVSNHGDHGALSPQKRNMSFSLNDLRTDDLQAVSRCSFSSSSSMSSAYSDSVLGNYDGHYGPSSHNYTEASKFSVYDILNKNAVGDARTLGVPNDNKKGKELPSEEKKNNGGGGVGKPQWFEKVLEDKEIFNMSEYENYARIKPRQDIPRNNNNNVNMKSRVQNSQPGRHNSDNQGKLSNTTSSKTVTEKQTQNLSSRFSTQPGNQMKNTQHTGNNKMVSDTENVQTNKQIQEKPNAKSTGNGPKPSIYSQNQSKSVYPHNSIRPRNTMNTLNSEQLQTDTPTRLMEPRTLSNRNQDASPNILSSRLSPEKSVNLTGRVSSENRNSQPGRLLFEKESSPSGRLSVEKKNTPVTSPIQKPYVKPLQNTGNKSVNNNAKTSLGGNQKLPFDVPRTMPRVPMKTSGYFPIFSSDGKPVAKIGKPKNNINNIPKLQTSPVRDFIENQENFQSQLPVLNAMSEPSQLNAPVFI